ncbi:hypothetical protein Syun_005791 [Stephania yunnanensis]|uniref:Uncharacterized protein n=1 Tax=Stephania yunnanensis TaxID=152371 RepID=A0AAP0KY10_9MAGN
MANGGGGGFLRRIKNRPRGRLACAKQTRTRSELRHRSRTRRRQRESHRRLLSFDDHMDLSKTKQLVKLGLDNADLILRRLGRSRDRWLG